MKVCIGENEYVVGSDEMGMLRESNDVLDNRDELLARLQDDGYLLIRGFHDREKVAAARTVMCEELERQGHLVPGSETEEARIGEGNKGSFWGGRKGLSHDPRMLAVLESDDLLAFFSFLFDEPALTFDYKWLRTVGHGEFTGAHYDRVYMGRGSDRLLTAWTPLEDVSLEHGPLTLCVGSHKLDGFRKVRETYGSMDVDRDHVQGSFTMDSNEVINKFGGHWETSPFKAGDILLLGMFTMHMSLNNATDTYRISTDTRFQPASDPVDERWMGENPIAHYGWNAGDKNVSMEKARAEWGV